MALDRIVILWRQSLFLYVHSQVTGDFTTMHVNDNVDDADVEDNGVSCRSSKPAHC